MRLFTAVLIGAAVYLALHIYYSCRQQDGVLCSQTVSIKGRELLRAYRRQLGSWKGWLTALAGIICLGYGYGMAVRYQLAYINCLRNEIVLIWLFFIALIDARERLIPRALTTPGYLVWLLFTVLAAGPGGSTVLNVLLFSLAGWAMGGGLFLICRLISRGGVGMGDIRVFSVLGLLYGMNYTFSIVFVTIVLMTFYGIGAILCKKKTMKSEAPMGPFIFASCVICFFLGI